MSMHSEDAEFAGLLQRFHDTILAAYRPSAQSISSGTSATAPSGPRVLPDETTLATAASALLPSLPSRGLGLTPASTHLLTDLLPGLNQASLSPHYYGFVIGGTTPAALLADLLVSTLDQNVQVHLPAETLATVIEDRALTMLLELFRLPPADWRGRTFTTGATGANILGLATGREALLSRALGGAADAVGELGLLTACQRAGVTGVQVLAALAHSSIPKAASIVGIGRANVHDIGRAGRGWELDLERLEAALAEAREARVATIVAVGLGEVNTGFFDPGLPRIRQLVDAYGGWIHVDAAFGAFARCVPGCRWADALELADSITGDGHKLLNVPYDCGFFFTRDAAPLSATCKNAAPYLAAAPAAAGDDVQPSPLNVGLENSRRFRALPVYATLAAYGAEGHAEMVQRIMAHARSIAAVVGRRRELELLAGQGEPEEVFMVVLFRARDERLNQTLKERINGTGRMYVSGTVWEGRKAVRCAVANWRVPEEPEGVCEVVEGVLEEVWSGFLKEASS